MDRELIEAFLKSAENNPFKLKYRLIPPLEAYTKKEIEIIIKKNQKIFNFLTRKIEKALEGSNKRR
jgi:hypothetical protein